MKPLLIHFLNNVTLVQLMPLSSLQKVTSLKTKDVNNTLFNLQRCKRSFEVVFCFVRRLQREFKFLGNTRLARARNVFIVDIWQFCSVRPETSRHIFDTISIYFLEDFDEKRCLYNSGLVSLRPNSWIYTHCLFYVAHAFAKKKFHGKLLSNRFIAQ